MSEAISSQSVPFSEPPLLTRVPSGPSIPPTRRRGVLNANHVRLLAFVMIALSIFACAVVCLLAVWDYADRDTAWKALSSVVIIAASMSAFVFVNEMFGRSMER